MKEDIKKRDTRQRRMVYDDVMKRCDHPKADDIYKDIHEVDENVSKGTVYRNLNTLSDDGLITHVKVPGSDRFDSRLDKHYHVICMICGKVIDAPVSYEQNYDDKVENDTGYKINRHRIIFEGICPECQKNKNI